ncbi:MucR family transcriptional regulator [Sphingobium rhizovicinum]|uniref:MucR family transcriptional regulator n=1 Tax=Sphingobium rhizovicinum TaxID=432308 RepID=A0ABV7NK24_9SPHN
MADTEKTDLAQLTVQLLSSYLSNNIVPREYLAELIKTTRAALSDEAPAQPLSKPEFVPAVSIRKSLASPNHILSLIDGKPYKMLKRHLAQHGLTPAQYRERYDLPFDYPMTAKAYSDERRATAARIGLGGRKPVTAATQMPGAAESVPQAAPVAAKVAPTPDPNPSSATDKANGIAAKPVVGAKRGRKPKTQDEATPPQKSAAATTKGKKSGSKAKTDALKPPSKPASEKPDAPAAAASAVEGDTISAKVSAEAPTTEAARTTRKKAAPTTDAPSSESKRVDRKPKAESVQAAGKKAEPIAAAAPSASQTTSASPAKVATKALPKGRGKTAPEPASGLNETASAGDVKPAKQSRKTLKIKTDA